MTALEQLRRNLLEHKEEPRFFTVQELFDLLERNHGDVGAASYEGLLQKAQADGVTLPDGARLENTREYWLTLARRYRPSASASLPRADEARV